MAETRQLGVDKNRDVKRAASRSTNDESPRRDDATDGSRLCDGKSPLTPVPRHQQMESEKPQEVKQQVEPHRQQRDPRDDATVGSRLRDGKSPLTPGPGLEQMEYKKPQEMKGQVEPLPQQRAPRLPESEDWEQQEIERLLQEVKRLSHQRVQRLRQSEDGKQQEIERLSQLLQNSEKRIQELEDRKQQEIDRLSEQVKEKDQRVKMLHRQMMERDVQFQEELSDPLRPSAIATMFKDAQNVSLRVSQRLIDSCCQKRGYATAERVCAVPVFICELFQFIFDKAQDKATQWNDSVNRVLSSDGIIDICIKDGTKNQAVVVKTSNRGTNIPMVDINASILKDISKRHCKEFLPVLENQAVVVETSNPGTNIPMVDINASIRKDISKRDCKEFLPFLETAVKTYCINSSNTTNKEFFSQLQGNSEFKELLTEIFKLSLLMHLSTPPLKIQTKKVTFDKKLHDVSGRDCIEGIGIKYVWPALVSDKGVHVLGKVFTGNDFAKPYI